MTTLAIMKARIADEIMRDDLTSQIALVIDEAIKYYQPKRFFFNESDTITFQTLSSDTIPVLYDIDAIYALIGTTQTMLHQITPEEYRVMSTPATTGQPLNWVYFQEALRLYPDPDQAYTIRIMAHYKLAAPASDAEAANRWMVEGEPLIRAHSKYLLFRDVIYDVEKASVCLASAQDEYKNLNSVTNKMGKSGFIKAMEF